MQDQVNAKKRRNDDVLGFSGFYEPPFVEASKRLAIGHVVGMGDWYAGFSPYNGLGAVAEGTWMDWVRLSRLILEADRERGNR